MESNRLIRMYLCELADRALRFHLHLDAVEREFYKSSPGLAGETAPRDKPLFIDSFRQCVLSVLEIVAHLARRSEQKEPKLTEADFASIFDVARHAFVCINRLHEHGLVHF